MTKPATCCRSSAVRLARMEAVFIALMVGVVLLSGFVSVLVVYRLMKADNS